MTDPTPVPVPDNTNNTKAMLMSFINSVLAFLLFFIAVAALPEVGGLDVTIPAQWIAYATALAAVLRTAVAWLNPKDPSFGLGSNN